MTNSKIPDLTNKSHTDLVKMAEALSTLSETKKYNKLQGIFPDKGRHARGLYKKHVAFMQAGYQHSKRAFVAANRIGKSFTGAVELAYHASGLYPIWWKGRRFTKPIKAWACAVATKQLREGIQELLFGSFSDPGTGILPKNLIVDAKGEIQTWAMAGEANCIGLCMVKHVSGGWSEIGFKTYAQGWEQFQGAKRDVIWLDEEPPDPKIFTECTTRTAGTDGNEDGILYCTFTPLLGFSTVVLKFMPNGQIPPGGVHPDDPEKFVLNATWEDCPHLSAKWKASQLQDYSAAERDARSRGEPSFGSGRIYPVEESFIVVKPFEIPEYFLRAYGLDFGWHNTAAIWVAKDPQTECYYCYTEYKRGQQAPYVHAMHIKSKGEDVRGAADPAGGGRNQKDGSKLIDEYLSLGLQLSPGDNAINAGIARILNLLESGQLKIFSTCTMLLNELRVYRYDTTNPNLPARNQDDHLLDALRYILATFDYVASTDSNHSDDEDDDYSRDDSSRDHITGY